ncbi:MAG TPA: ABC transporter substrate-binding protein [Usitatibacter sp.]|jgi:peptide/nickel transport system substrate-binding protein|nr:ABC transporter substrate-binding protein [Usitatibacter sp.]
MHRSVPCTLLASLAVLGPTVHAATPADTFVVAANMSQMITLDPAAINESFTAGFMRNVCDPLVRPDSDDPTKLGPGIAASWTLSPDSRTYTFTIRKGLRFPSGNPVTAEDVAWSMKRNLRLNLANAQRLREWDITKDNVESVVQAVDANTLRVTPPRPWAPGLFLFAFTDFRVAPTLDRREILAHESAGDLGNKWLATHSACLGPFRVATWRPQDLLTLERNDDYWRRKVAMKRIVVRHVPEAGAQRLLLEKGDVDQAADIDPADFPALERDPNVRLDSRPSLAVSYMMFNMGDARFRNPKLFEAFRYLWDYRELQDTLLQGHSIVRQSIVPNGVFGALPKDYMPYKLDIARAKRLLAEAGYPDGFSAELAVLNSFPYPDLAQHLQQNALKAGVKLKITQMIGAQLYQRARARKFEIYMAGYGYNYPDANNMMLRQAYNTDNSDRSNETISIAWRAGWDPGAWVNDTIRAAQVEPDQEKRRAMYEELQKRINATSPIIYLFQRVSVNALAKDVKVFQGTVFGDDYSSIEKR